MAQSASTVGSNIPQLWAAELQKARRKLLSAAQGCNRMYEDRVLRGGDTVRISTVGDITINTAHSRTADLTLQALQTTDQSLVIDAEDDFAFYLDDVDAKQVISDLMPESMSRAAYKIRDVMDQYIFTKMNASAANDMGDFTVGLGGSDSDIYELMVDVATALDNVDAPEEGRFVFVPPSIAGLIRKDPRRVGFGTSENLRVYGSGYIGTSIGGLDIFISRNLPTSGSSTTLLAGTKSATTLAEQITKYETVRHPLRFGDIHKGLHVYGAKVVRPDELVKLDVTIAA
jgi:hypothetical protein